MADIKTAMDSYLGGRSKVMTFQKKFMAKWCAPYIDMITDLSVQRLKNLSPEVQDQLKELHPKAWANLMEDK